MVWPGYGFVFPSGTSCDVRPVFIEVAIEYVYRTSESIPDGGKMALPFSSFFRTFSLFIAISSLSQAQIFTALTHMTDFVRLEQSFSEYLDEYLQHSPSVSSELERFANDVKNHLKNVEDEDMEIFLGHPVNSYLLVRRFLREWRHVADKLDATDPIGKGNNSHSLYKLRQNM